MATSQKVRQNQTQVNLLDTVEDMDQSRRYVKKLVGISYCYVSTGLKFLYKYKKINKKIINYVVGVQTPSPAKGIFREQTNRQDLSSANAEPGARGRPGDQILQMAQR